MIEILVAVALLGAIVAAVFAVVSPAEGRFGAELEAADMEQRLRVAADTLGRDLLMAGAGTEVGSHIGPLSDWLPAVLPFRSGALDHDPPGTFRDDTVTVLYVPDDRAQGTLAAPIGPGRTTLRLDTSAGCQLPSSTCGFAAGMTVLVYDGTGSFDTLTVTSVTGDEWQLRPNRPGGVMSRTYAAGSQATQAIQRTYYLKIDPARGTYQLMRYDGGSRSGVPVVDQVVDLAFEYAGEPRPPRLIKAITEPEGPWTTYGPRPPPPDIAERPFAVGENCIFAFDHEGAAHAPRLRLLDTAKALVPLGARELADGDVWCPNRSDPDRYDADLLRIRGIGVTVRVQSAIAAFRGPAGVLFRNGGASTSATRFLPDREVRFRISPRNLALPR